MISGTSFDPKQQEERPRLVDKCPTVDIPRAMATHPPRAKLHNRIQWPFFLVIRERNPAIG
jgi:hypothetical protein